MNSKYKEILFVHANLPSPTGAMAPPDRGVLRVMNLFLKDQATAQQLWEEVRDVLNVFNIINTEINGVPPTGTQWQDKARYLDREIFYAINLILHSSRTIALSAPGTCHFNVLEEISKTGWVVSAALDAVLAGDCDDLNEWIATEAMVREINLKLV
jgi:hypothetical protein